jgi:hypothetical protein
VSDDVETSVTNQVCEFFGVHTDLVKPRFGRDIGPFSGGKVIDHIYVESVAQKEVGHV